MFNFRRIAVRAGLVSAETEDLSNSEWALMRKAIQEGRLAYDRNSNTNTGVIGRRLKAAACGSGRRVA
jgi:hypothetical protein